MHDKSARWWEFGWTGYDIDDDDDTSYSEDDDDIFKNGGYDPESPTDSAKMQKQKQQRVDRQQQEQREKWERRDVVRMPSWLPGSSDDGTSYKGSSEGPSTIPPSANTSAKKTSSVDPDTTVQEKEQVDEDRDFVAESTDVVFDLEPLKPKWKRLRKSWTTGLGGIGITGKRDG